LLKAREKLLLCTSPVCPRAIRVDCARWLAEVEAATPSLVVLAKDKLGHDIGDLRVTIDDGAVVLSKLDGQPIPLDPGRHVLRYERSGESPAEDWVVLGTGEKNRILSLSVVQPNDVAGLPSAMPPPSLPTEPPSSPRRFTVPIPALILGAVAVAGIASFTYFGVRAQSELSRLRSSGCAPHCQPSEVDAARRNAIVADISLSAAVLTAAVALWVALAPHAEPSPTSAKPARATSDLRVDFGLTRNRGAEAGWVTSF
jgi:hypothetical protein